MEIIGWAGHTTEFSLLGLNVAVSFGVEHWEFSAKICPMAL